MSPSIEEVLSETFEIVEPERIAFDQVNATEQGAHLIAHWHTADRQRRADAQISAVNAKAFEDSAR
jgi:hypothetical protein